MWLPPPRNCSWAEARPPQESNRQKQPQPCEDDLLRPLSSSPRLLPVNPELLTHGPQPGEARAVDGGWLLLGGAVTTTNRRLGVRHVRRVEVHELASSASTTAQLFGNPCRPLRRGRKRGARSTLGRSATADATARRWHVTWPQSRALRQFHPTALATAPAGGQLHYQHQLQTWFRHHLCQRFVATQAQGRRRVFALAAWVVTQRAWAPLVVGETLRQQRWQWRGRGGAPPP